jgi:hypothetical protein
VEVNVDIGEIASDLIEAHDQLQALAANHAGLTNDPLFYEPIETIKRILEEIE